MSILSSIQQQCANRLAADPFFANVPILTERIGDLDSEIALALGPLNGRSGKTGLVAILLTPNANVNFENLFGPFFDDIQVVVRVVENVLLNQDPNTGTNIPAADAAEKICGLLHHFQPDSANSPVIARKPSIRLWRSWQDQNQNVYQNPTYDCRFRTAGGLTSILPQTATPVITNNSGVRTLTCATAGAAMFHTLDGSNPMPRNGTFYNAPFTPGVGHTLKVRAWLAGYLASETAMQTT